jgi:hypothetical protein
MKDKNPKRNTGRFTDPVEFVNHTRLSWMAEEAGFGDKADDFIAGWVAGNRNAPAKPDETEAYLAGHRAGKEDRKPAVP